MLWALNDAPTDDATEALVLIALADNAHDDGTCAWPSHATLARRARCSVSTVQRALRRLESSGLITKGDQQTVAHLRADRRPVVYDLALPPQAVSTGGENTAGHTDRPFIGSPTAGHPRTPRPVTGDRGTVLGTVREPGSRPLSAQAQATLTRRAEQAAARERGRQAAERRRQEQSA